MNFSQQRRKLVKSGAILTASSLMPLAFAQNKIPLIFSETMTDQDIRAKLLVEKDRKSTRLNSSH